MIGPVDKAHVDLLAEGLRQRAGLDWTIESLGKSGRVAVPLLIDLLRETDATCARWLPSPWETWKKAWRPMPCRLSGRR